MILVDDIKSVRYHDRQQHLEKNIFNQHCLLMALHLILAPLGAKLPASTSLKDNQGAAKNINQTWSCIRIYPYWI